MDLIGPLPASNGYDAIQVWVDTFTKRIHVEPVSIKIKSEGVARLTRDRVIRYHGVPRKVISDRDPRYVSEFMRELNRLLGTEMNPSTAYHPQTDGQTERMNKEIEHYLWIYINHHQSDWSDWLPLAEFAYNDKVNASTKASPFFLDHGYHPWKGIEGPYKSNVESAEEFAKSMKRVRDDAAAAIKKAQERMKKYYDQKRVPAPEFKVGDQVYVDGSKVEQNRPSEKLNDRRVGPYTIVEKVGSSAYRLELPAGSRTYPVFNETELTLYHEPPPHRREKRPPAVIVDGAEEWEVEEVLKKRKMGCGWQYYIKWKGYPHSRNTWETKRKLNNDELIEEFEKRSSEATQRQLAPSEETPGVPILAKGHWDYLIHCYKPKHESLPYPSRKLFNYQTGHFVEAEGGVEDERAKLPTPVDEDVDLEGGVMSRLDQIAAIIEPMIAKVAVVDKAVIVEVEDKIVEDKILEEDKISEIGDKDKMEAATATTLLDAKSDQEPVKLSTRRQVASRLAHALRRALPARLVGAFKQASVRKRDHLHMLNC